MDDPRILGPIPTPPAQRWREVRLLYLPRTAFVLGIFVAAWLWTHAVAPATLVAEADTQQVDVRTLRTGMISGLSVGLLEQVQAGQVVGYIKPSVASASEASSPVNKSPDAASKTNAIGSVVPPLPLVAPIDGVISAVLKHPGEMVEAGDAVLRITSKHAERLTGFLRQPLSFEPKPGMVAEVRTRNSPRRSAFTTITGVGAAMEAIPPSLLAAMHLPEKPAPEHALRIHLAVPRGFPLRPGEHVDIIVH
jgi:multidrug resistance efflux pump